MFSTFVLEETRSGEDEGLVGCWLLYSFYVLILVLKTYKALLNRNPNSRHKSEMKRQNCEQKETFQYFISCELQLARFPIPSPAPRVCSTHVHWVGGAMQPSQPLSCPSPTALNLSQHQSLFQWVGSLHQVAKILELQHQSFIFFPYHTLFESLNLKENVELQLAIVGIFVWF